MFIRPIHEVVDRLVTQAKVLGEDCTRVFVAVSGGVDSTAVVTILCLAFGPKNVIALFRDIQSDPQHIKDVQALQKALGFRLIHLDVTPEYESLLLKIKDQFIQEGLDWKEQTSPEAESHGWKNAYASMKSRFTTPLAGFIAKAVDQGHGRIFGTGNAEEDGLIRYYDKFGDGAVDNNILDGLTKMEVRQIVSHFSRQFQYGDIFQKIAQKIPSADLWGCGDVHNDEAELMVWARNRGYDQACMTYGDLENGGTIAWVLDEDEKHGVVTGKTSAMDQAELKRTFGYNEEQVQNILFIREIETITRHKIEPPRGLSRKILRQEGYVK
jgi:NH3-dependent NAD+ synthetase